MGLLWRRRTGEVLLGEMARHEKAVGGSDGFCFEWVQGSSEGV